MKCLKLYIISAIAFVSLLSANLAFADNFHLSQDNETKLIEINKDLSKESESLTIYVDGHKLSPKSSWHVSEKTDYENQLEIDTSKKSVKFDVKSITISTNKQQTLRDQLIQNLNDGQSVNEAIHNFLVDYQKAINYETNFSARELIVPVFVVTFVFVGVVVAFLMMGRYSRGVHY